MFKRLEMLLSQGWPSLRVLSIDGDGEGTGGGSDSGPLDRDSRIESALSIFEGDGGDDTGDEADDNGAADGDDAAGEKVDDQEAGKEEGEDQNKEGQLTDEQLQKDPRFQALDQFQKDHKPVFDKYGIPDAKELDLQLADSAVLYQIMQGKGTPSQLLDTMSQAAHWSKDQQTAVAQDLIGWLTKAGFLKDGQNNTQGAAPRKENGQFKDPLQTRVEQMERERKEERERQETQRESERQSKIFDKYKVEINRLCGEKGIDKADFDFMGREVRALITPQEFKSVTDAIAKDNFVEVRKLFAQVHNREVERLKRFTTSVTKAHERRTRSAPRVPAGGAPPAPAGQQKRNLSNRDERLAAAAAEWEK